MMSTASLASLLLAGDQRLLRQGELELDAGRQGGDEEKEEVLGGVAHGGRHPQSRTQTRGR